MPRIPKRKTYWIGKKAEQGRLQAQREADRKKPIQEKIIELFQKLHVNPLELAAAGGLAVLIHQYITNSKELRERLQGDIANPDTEHAWIMLLFKGAIESVTTAGGEVISKLVYNNDALIWLVSFGIAYFMIRQGGAVLGLLGQGIGGVVKMFFGGTVAVP